MEYENLDNDELSNGLIDPVDNVRSRLFNGIIGYDELKSSLQEQFESCSNYINEDLIDIDNDYLNYFSNTYSDSMVLLVDEDDIYNLRLLYDEFWNFVNQLFVKYFGISLYMNETQSIDDIEVLKYLYNTYIDSITYPTQYIYNQIDLKIRKYNISYQDALEQVVSEQSIDCLNNNDTIINYIASSQILGDPEKLCYSPFVLSNCSELGYIISR